MKRGYYCPYCKSILDPGTKVIFVAEYDDTRCLVLLSPDLGDYTTILGAGFPLVEGAAYLFRCPVCHADLTSPTNQNLVEIELRNEHGRRNRVAFSRICGEHATLVLTEGGVRSFGEHADRYAAMNFFGAGEPDE